MAKVIYPIVARSFTFLPGPISYLSDKHYLTHINESDHGTVLRYCPNDYQGLLTSRFRCIYYEADDTVDDSQIGLNGQMASFTLNYFASLDALEFPVAILIKDGSRRRSASFKPPTANRILSAASSERYQLTRGTTIKDLQKLFSLLTTAASNDPRVKIMMDPTHTAKNVREDQPAVATQLLFSCARSAASRANGLSRWERTPHD
jgi:hypothetical protein